MWENLLFIITVSVLLAGLIGLILKLPYFRLSAAQVRLEQLNARQRELSNERDLTLNKVLQLRQRLEELRTASLAISLRTAQSSEAIVRPASRLRSSLLYGTVGGLAGIILGIGFIVGREALRRTNLLPEVRAKPTGD